MISALKKIFETLAAPLLVFVILVLLWEIVIRFFELPRYLVPSPGDIATAISANFKSLVSATALTALAALCGFALSLAIGSLAAFAFSQSTSIRLGFYPYAIFLQTVPIVAIAPLIIIWFGTGLQSVILVSFIISLFPVVTNATEGLLRVDPNLLDLFRLHGASRWQVLFKLRLPNAVPYLVAGAKIASGLSVIGAIVGEFSAGYGTNAYGLGYLIVLASGQLNTPLLFAAIFSCTLLGVATFGIVTLAGNAVMRRWRQNE